MAVIQIGISPVSYRHIRAHAHSLWEIVYNFEGEGTTIVGKNEYCFSPGSIICQPPGAVHTKNSSRGFRDIFLQTDSFPLGDTLPKDRPLIFQDDAEKSFLNLISLAHRVYHKQEANYRPLAEALYQAMYQLLLSWSVSPEKNTDVKRIKNEMVSSFSDPEFSMSELLKDTGYCEDHLRKLFKKEAGYTPHAYLQKLRMDNAKKMIANNSILNLNIEEIALMSGFYDTHYFHRMFKKETGMTPRQYQRYTEKDNFQKNKNSLL